MGFFILALLGILGFIVGIILLIVSFASKKPKKMPLIVLLSSLIITVVGAVGSVNYVIHEEYGDKIGISDVIYMQRITEPFEEVNASIEEYNLATDNFDLEDEDSKKELQTACDNLIAKAKNFKSVNSSNKDWSVYKNIQNLSDTLIEVGEKTPNAYYNDDLDEQSKILDLFYKAMEYMSEIKKTLAGL
ncbi:MAG: hypothetical protein Q4P31_07365 [Andreesenia angusta]|nr:hypothetical protein [Andreesenia angusta]